MGEWSGKKGRADSQSDGDGKAEADPGIPFGVAQGEPEKETYYDKNGKNIGYDVRSDVLPYELPDFIQMGFFHAGKNMPVEGTSIEQKVDAVAQSEQSEDEGDHNAVRRCENAGQHERDDEHQRDAYVPAHILQDGI